jgi:hypothetical protein
MSEPTIPVSETVLRQLEELSAWLGLSVPEVLARAVKEQYDRQFWAEVNAGYAAMRADPEAWAEELAERRAWEATLMDGLDPSERWTEDGTASSPADQPRP